MTLIILASCGGGGSSTTPITSCVALPGPAYLPSAGVVPVSCVTTNVSTSPTNTGQCCRTPHYSYDPYGGYTNQGYSYSQIGVNYCTSYNAQYSCPP